MKILSIAIALSIAGVLNLPAQTTSGQANMPAPTAYAITTRDGNSQVWQRTTYETGPGGKVIPRIHKYTELATGLNHQVGGQWVASDETITILPDGTAAATNGQHQAYFPSDIYNGEIKLVTPDGKVLLSQPTALSYDDGSNTVLIAVLTNSIGQLVSSNQIIYPNAFAGIDADLRYTYTIAGFEQDVILHEQPSTPASLGLNPDTTRIQVMTEFFNPPAPIISTSLMQTAAGELENAQLTFGTMRMVQGKAFSMGTNSSSVPVNKQWMQMSGRQFLVEEVPTAALADDLENLPRPVSQTLIIPLLRVASGHLTLPAQYLVKATPAPHNRPIQFAEAVVPTRGLVLDYQTLDSSETENLIRGDTTYYISGSVTLYGTNIFEGGAVLKYAKGAELSLYNSVPLSWQAASYRPIVFTAVDDNTIGESISGSTGSPSGSYAAIALLLEGDTSLSNFRIIYAADAICSISGDSSFYDGQIVNCQIGFENSSGHIKLRNMLFANLLIGFLYESASIDAQNTTFNFVSTLLNNSSASGLNWNNCIMANITAIFESGSDYLSGSNNGFYNTAPFGTDPVTNNFYPFQTVGGGSYYLTNGCDFHNAGTTNIDSSLLSDLAAKSTYPPMLYFFPGAYFSTNLNLYPQAQRDNYTLPDLGYHYDPLDYLFGPTFMTNATITINPGTAVGFFGTNSYSYGFALSDNSQLICQGAPNNLNRLVEYNTVQEETPPNWVEPSYALVTHFFGSLPFFINCRFTDWSIMAQDSAQIQVAGSYPLNFQECQFHGGSILSYYPTVTLTNCLLERVNTDLEPADTNVTVFINNLILGGTFTFGPAAQTNSVIQNNLFDSVTIPDGLGAYGITYIGGHNAYVTNCNTLDPVFVSDIILSNSPVYQVGTLGNYYLPTNSPLINTGSVPADQVGLYHFTVQTNQVQETNSIVDIGYHYVATDSNGNPLDTNGDGIPDYLEDANGNGLVDSGEIGWNIVGDLGLQVIISQPRNGSTIP